MLRGKLGGAVVAAILLLGCTLPVAASAAFSITEWDGEIESRTAGTLAAGEHPESIDTTIGVSRHVSPLQGLIPDAAVRNLVSELPAGFVGATNAADTCKGIDMLTPKSDHPTVSECPVASIVGRIIVRVAFFPGSEEAFEFSFPIHNMEPRPGVPATFGLNIVGVPVLIDVEVRDDYGVNLRITNQNQGLAFLGATPTFWGTPGDPSHDAERCLTPFPVFLTECPGTPGDPVSGTNQFSFGTAKPLLTLPTSCSPLDRGLPFGLHLESWEQPTSIADSVFETHLQPPDQNTPLGTSRCDRVPFSPTLTVQPTTDEAETPTGLEISLEVPAEGINSPTGISQSHLKDTVVTLPEGMTVNPSQAEGLAVCSPSQIGLTSGNSGMIRFDKAKLSCPDASQLGEVRVDTPLLDDPLTGSAFLAAQDDPSAPGAENPFDSLLGLYFALEGAGVRVKLAGEIVADPKTGQLVVRFLNNPQVPFSRFGVKLKGGQRAPLAMPPTCGIHTVKAELTPWARPDQPVTVSDSFQITRGPNGGPCPTGNVPPFKPAFSAGSINNNAAAHTPFVMRVQRADGEQDMTRFSAVLPPGVLGKLAGIDKCPDSAIGLAQSKTGRQEIASPSCPANSEIGHNLVGAGVGSILTYVPGKVYLGGPVKGDPLSVIAITPVVAGPFDIGTVVVREALALNPKTAEVEVDGGASDPIPHILKGIPAKLRDLRVYVDRDKFILNPTSCEESSAKATLFGSFLDVLDPADDKPVSLSDRFQAANCAALGFKPKLTLSLKGGTKRGGHPGLKALYKPRAKDANVKGLVVRLPRSAFLDQAHIRTICTRVQFAADACPPAAQYGYIKAWTPLLEEPLAGPVWLRSSNHKLPDLVFDLHGLVDVEVATRIDSAKGGIRATVEDAPDAPLSKVDLRMQGGKKGLIINSRNLCGALSRANVEFAGHNGKQATANPVMRAECGGKRTRAKRAAHRSAVR